jgi:signal transduction histidine kinase
MTGTGSDQKDRIRVLLIEDDEDDYIVLRDHLREARGERFELVWASTPAQARDALRTGGFHAYLIDNRLGELTGLDLMSEIHDRGDRTPVILLTGYGDHAVDAEAMRRGASDYLVKGELSPQLLERALRYSIHRAQMQTQAVAQDRMASIGLLASSLAHEIGTPLGVMRGRAEMLTTLGPSPDPAEVARGAQVIIAQIDRVSGLIRSLLNLARGDAPAQIGPVSASRAARDVLELLGHELRKHGIAVEDELGAGPDVQVMASSEKLHQILLNLAVNAIHAIGLARKTGRTDGHRLRLFAEPREDTWAIAVQDTGSGMSPEVMRNLFRPFFTTKDIGVGTGLGLATAQRIVKSWNGSIEVESQEGRGTTFRVVIPRA